MAEHHQGSCTSSFSHTLDRAQAARGAHPRGNPLYPMPTITRSLLTMQAPTCFFGSLLLCAESEAIDMKYASLRPGAYQLTSATPGDLRRQRGPGVLLTPVRLLLKPFWTAKAARHGDAFRH
jgi:hypothetical protein